MIVEQHDGDIGDERGTLCGRTIVDYAYQAEMWVKEMLGEGTHRIYVHSDGMVWSVFACSERNKPSYVGKTFGSGDGWELPFVNEEATRIAVATFGTEQHGEVHTMDEAAAWAAEQLKKTTVATAVVLDQDGVLAAWEKGPEGPVLVAKGPRPFPKTAAA